MAQQLMRQPSVSRSATTPASRLSSRALLYLCVLIGAVVSMFPFFWTLVSSGKSIQEMYYYPPTLWPAAPQFLANYTEVFNTVPFAQWFVNTVVVTVASLIGTVISATLVAYAFSRFRFPGRDIFFFITLATIMLPVEVTLIPTYLLFKNFNWIDTYLPLIVPSCRWIWTKRPRSMGPAVGVFCGRLLCRCASRPSPPWPRWGSSATGTTFSVRSSFSTPNPNTPWPWVCATSRAPWHKARPPSQSHKITC